MCVCVCVVCHVSVCVYWYVRVIFQTCGKLQSKQNLCRCECARRKGMFKIRELVYAVLNHFMARDSSILDQPYDTCKGPLGNHCSVRSPMCCLFIGQTSCVTWHITWSVSSFARPIASYVTQTFVNQSGSVLHSCLTACEQHPIWLPVNQSHNKPCDCLIDQSQALLKSVFGLFQMFLHRCTYIHSHILYKYSSSLDITRDIW